MIGFREGGENGGPYNSHLRIMESKLKSKFQFIPLLLPKGRLGIIGLWKILHMAKQIRAAKPDAVQIVGLEMIGAYMILACRLANVKNIILAIHGSTTEAIEFNENIFRKTIMIHVEKFTLKSAKFTFGVSDYVKTIMNVAKYSKNYIGTIYNMNHIIDSCSKRNIERSKLDIEESKFVILSTGRITREKGYDTLVNVIKNFKNNINIVFVIAGNGEYLSTMELLLQDQIGTGQVRLLGYRKDISDILKSGDIFIMPSYHETLCMSLIEAGKAGLALVASKVGGVKEIISDGHNGFLVESGNASEFTKKILKLYIDRELLSLFSNNIKQTISSKFSNIEIEKKLDRLYTLATSSNNV